VHYSEVPLADGMVLVHPAHLGLMTIDLVARHGLMTIDLMADGSGSSGSFLDCRFVVSTHQDHPF
jgi:hypothetical protein